MSNTTLTLTLEGEVPLEQFAESMMSLKKLVDALGREVSGHAKIAWIVSDLSSGSASATLRGETSELEDVERVVAAYGIVGRSLEDRAPIPYSERVRDAANALVATAKGRVTSIRLETPISRSTVVAGGANRETPFLAGYGSIEGRIETLRSRNRLSFTLYDMVDDQAVYCGLRAGQIELVRDAWGKLARVSGWIKRDASTGRPIEINPVEQIEIQQETPPGSYRKARGIAPSPVGAPSIETVIRRLRDGE
jgi:hypothetical protein